MPEGKWVSKANLQTFWQMVKSNLASFVAEDVDDVLPTVVPEEVNKVLPAMVGEQIDNKFGDDIGDNVTSWLTEHVTPAGSAVVVDDTLTIQGAAADAKKTGDEISGLKEDLNVVEKALKPKFVGKSTVNLWDKSNGYTTGAVNSNGDITTVSAYANYKTATITLFPGTYTFYSFASTTGTSTPVSTYQILYWGSKTNYYEGTTDKITITLDTIQAVMYSLPISADIYEYIMVVEGSTTITPYSRYSQKIEDNVLLSDAMEIQVGKSIEEAVDTLGIGSVVRKNTVNLWDNNEAYTDGAVTNDGIISTAGAYANYKTAIITLPKGTYTFYCFAPNISMDEAISTYILLYWGNSTNYYAGTVSSKTITLESETTVKYSAPISGNIYLYVMIVNGSSVITPYKEYDIKIEEGVHLSDDMVDEISEIVSYTSPLKNKKLVVCGDSFSDYTNKQYESGRFVGKYCSYPRIIALRNNMNLVETFMNSGRTIAYPESGTFSNSLTAPSVNWNYQNIPNDADYILIMLGINDYMHGLPNAENPIQIGTINDNTINTYYGAYNTVLTWLRNNRPFSHIGIIIENGTESQAFHEAQIALAKKYGYPYLDMNGSDRCPAMTQCYNPDIPASVKSVIQQSQIIGDENFHPKWQTHEYESTFIEAFLNTL